MHFSTFLGIVLGGVLLHVLEPPGATSAGLSHPGFATIALFGGLCRLASASVLHRSPEPAFAGSPSRSGLGRFFATGRGRNVMVILVGTACLHVTVYFSSPYFTPFMLDVLRLDYIVFMVAIGAQVGTKVLAMPYWGRLVDRHSTRSVYAIAVLLAALVPLPWLFVGGPTGAIFAQVFSGLAWSAHEVALFTLLLESTRRGNRPFVYAAHGLCNAMGQVGGSLVGAALVAGSGFLAAFSFSLGGRLVVAVVLPLLVRDLGRGRSAPVRRVFRLIGYRPGGGSVHRPVFDPETPEGDA